MRINAITSAYSDFKSVRIMSKSKENIKRPYLYNEILDITRKFKVPATFHNNKIEMPNPTLSVITKLNELGIEFQKIM